MAIGRPSPPIGVFDSGVGGIAVLRRIHARMPNADTVYVADQAHAPYGERPASDVIERGRALTDHLAAQGARTIVLACNTATAAAIDALRADYEQLTFVGMEPAIKPAAQRTSTNIIGVLATEGTLSADRYQALARQHASEVSVIHRIGDGLAMAVERGEENAETTKRSVRSHGEAFRSAGADVVVLGCTHYSFISHHLSDGVPPGFTIIDPADAVARQVARVAGPETVNGSGVQSFASTTQGAARARLEHMIGSPVDFIRV